MRGMLTETITQKSQKFLNREITQKELRLYPYIDYCIKNACQDWSYHKLDPEEIKILDLLSEEHHLVYSSEKIIVTRAFYDYMQDILAESYIDTFM